MKRELKKGKIGVKRIHGTLDVRGTHVIYGPLINRLKL